MDAATPATPASPTKAAADAAPAAAAPPTATTSSLNRDLCDKFFAFKTDDKGTITHANMFAILNKFHALSGFSMQAIHVLTDDEPLRKEVISMITGNKFASVSESRAVACMLGMSLGDSIGCAVEFMPYRPDGGTLVKGMGSGLRGKFRLHPGQWTDDSSMGLCLADSLLINKGDIDGYDLMFRFLAWWHYGYCNGLEEGRGSVGLGGNISESFRAFCVKPMPATPAGDKNTSGNGSVMRNAAIPIVCASGVPMDKALKLARTQSYSTHQGTQAAECCALLSFLCIHAINSTTGDKAQLFSLLSQFVTDEPSVKALSLSQAEASDPVNRNWNWKDPNFRYSPDRAGKQPGYIGSYCMDAMAMALHCVWTTSSFSECVLKCANFCGDADSVASVAGQIAGALYGVGGDKGVPLEWYEVQRKWDRDGDIATRALRLYRHLY